MAEILHRILISAPAERVLALIATAEGVREWWTPNVDAKPEKGFVDRFRFEGGSIEFPFRVDEVSPSRFAATCVEGPKVPPEWLGTRMEFDLLPGPSGRVDLRFSHSHWKRADEYFAMCNTTWGDLMFRLRDAAEGKGRGPHFEG